MSEKTAKPQLILVNAPSSAGKTTLCRALRQKILDARERERGDRVLGRVRGLTEIVHGFCSYDLTVDTAALPPEACVAEIVAALARRSAA